MRGGAADGASINRSRAWILLACVVVAVLLEISLHGVLEEVVRGQIEETTENSFKIYGVARIFNRAISIAQTFEIPFTSIQVGEWFDPVNDAVERLSWVTAWAIGSLILQRIVLEVASTGVLEWGFWILGLAAISALLFLIYGPERFRDAVSRNLATGVMRTFFIVAIFRFIVPAFISIGFLFSSAMLETKIHEDMKYLSATAPELELEDLEKKEVEKPDGETSWFEWLLPDVVSSSIHKLRDLGSDISLSMRKWLNTLFVWSRQVAAKASGIIKTMTRLLALVAIQNFVLPLIFLVIAVKCSRPIVRFVWLATDLTPGASASPVSSGRVDAG